VLQLGAAGTTAYICRRFASARIFSSGSSACTRSVFCCVRPSRNEN